MLASLGYFGFTQFDGVAAWVLGCGLPLAPRRVGHPRQPEGQSSDRRPARILLEVVLLGSGPVALAAVGKHARGDRRSSRRVHLGLTFVFDQRRAGAV